MTKLPFPLIRKYLHLDPFQDTNDPSFFFLSASAVEAVLEEADKTTIHSEERIILKPEKILKPVVVNEEMIDAAFNSWQSGSFVDHLKKELFK